MQTTERTEEQTDEFAWAFNQESRAQAALKLTPAEVAARLRPYMANLVMPSLPDVTFSLDEEGIYFSRGYWRVPIQPSRDPKRLSLIAEALGALDDKLKSRENFLITLEIGDPLTEE